MHGRSGMISAPLSLDITTLGRFEIRRDHALLNGGNWHRRTVCDLFKLLITVEQHRLHREQIQEIFWPASSSEQAANSFGKTLYLLRRALEPDLPMGSSSSYVTLDRGILLLRPEHMRIDVDLFEASTRQLQIKMRNRSSGKDGELQCCTLLDEFDSVLSMYSGDYLPEDLYEDWVQSRRDHLRRLYCWLLENAAELAMEAAMGLRASEYLQDLLERNPTDEQMDRQLMHVYARIGRRSDALNQFQRLNQVLRDELHTNPLPATVELYRAIQSGHIASDLVSSYHLPARQDQAWHTLQVIEINRTAQSPGNGSKLVDRDEEMQRLQRAYLLAQAGQPRVTFVCGEP